MFIKFIFGSSVIASVALAKTTQDLPEGWIALVVCILTGLAIVIWKNLALNKSLQLLKVEKENEKQDLNATLAHTKIWNAIKTTNTNLELLQNLIVKQREDFNESRDLFEKSQIRFVDKMQDIVEELSKSKPRK